MSIVLTEDRGAVRHIVMNRPEKRNAINRRADRRASPRALQRRRRTTPPCSASCCAARARCSPPAWTSTTSARSPPSRSTCASYAPAILAAWNLCEEMTKPTIAQIHGGCIGGAMELALACDLRTMAAEAVIGLVETRVGLIPDVGGCSRLPSVVGLGRAKEMIMTSKLVDGTEAERIGLVNRVAPAEELDGAPRARRGAARMRPVRRRPRQARDRRLRQARARGIRSSRRSRSRRPAPRAPTSRRAHAPSPRSASRSSAGADFSGR